MLNKWDDKFSWIHSGFTWSKTERNYTQNVLDTDDIYFRWEKYVSGVCFSYVNNLKDIYKTDFLTGDGTSIFNMYNEYELLYKFYKNFKLVDIAIDYNLDITQQYTILDGINIKENMTILLYNQFNSKENNVYIINNNKLKLTNYIDTNETSKYFKVNIRLGSKCFKEFSLNSNSESFPTTTSNKNFIETYPYIIKHLINYNIYDTINSNKLMFLDYDLSRKQYEEPAKNFNNVIIPTSSFLNDDDYIKFNYKYEQYNYIANSNENLYYYENNTIYNNLSAITNISGRTVITIPSTCTLFNNDYDNQILNLKIDSVEYITGTTTFNNYSTSYGYNIILTGYTINNWIYYASGFVANSGYTTISADWIASGNTIIVDEYFTIDEVIINGIYREIYLKEYLPDYILKDFYKPFYNYAIKNFSVLNTTYFYPIIDDLSKVNDLKRVCDISYYNDFITCNYDSNNFIISTGKNFKDIYFDYSSFNIETKYNLYDFSTDYLYSKYNLKDFVSNIINYNSDLILNYNFEMNSFLHTGMTTSTCCINVVPYFDNDKNYFTKYTFVYLNINNISTNYIGLIKDINYEDNYMIIELQNNVPINFSLTKITNISKISEISEILNEVYINNNALYKKHQIYITKNIYNAYAKLISDLDINSIYRLSISGLLYEENNLFILKLYNFYTKNNIWNIVSDTKLLYKPIEIFRIGIDVSTSMPYIIKDENIIENLEEFNVIENINNDTNEIVSGDSDTTGDLVIES